MTRLDREKQTLRLMIMMHCRGRHRTPGGLCPPCGTLYRYALERLERCPFGEAKPACAKCPVHCYRPAMREEIRRVMRFAGPRMLFFHPILALLHLKDRFMKTPRPAERTNP